MFQFKHRQYVSTVYFNMVSDAGDYSGYGEELVSPDEHRGNLVEPLQGDLCEKRFLD